MRKPQVRLAHFNLITRSPERVRNFHHLDVNVKIDVSFSLVKRQHPIDTVDPLDEGNQLRLAPDNDLPRDIPQRPGKPDELNGVAQAMIAAHQHCFSAQVLAAPDPLQVTRPIVLAEARSAEVRNIPIAE
jgi:hypothetical protein